MIAPHLPALIVVVPLVAGLVALFLGRGHLPWLLTLLVTWAVFALSATLLGRVLVAGAPPVEYAMGSWPAPWGIVYRVDAVNAFVLTIVSGIAAVCAVFARLSVAAEIPAERWRFFYSAWLLCLTGLLGITITGDAFNLYVLLEIASLSTYTLVALGVQKDRRALTAAFRYLILGTVGATFLLLGIGHLYMKTGTLNMVDLADRLAGLQSDRVVLTAFALIVTGLGLKVALFPLHMWLPNAYTYAPSVVTAFLAATATKVGAYMTFRFLFTVFGLRVTFDFLSADVFLIGFSCLAILVASVLAIRQNNIKRLLAYSSVAQIGYIMLGLGLHNHASVTGAVVHVFNHAVMKGGLFLALGAVVYRLGGATIGELRGLGRRMPLTAAAIVVGGMGLVGVPATAGFISKWYLVAGCLHGDAWPLAVVILVGSILALLYVWRVVEALYFAVPENPSLPVREAPLALLVPTWVLIGASLYFGLHATFTVATAKAAAVALGVGE
ncbi:MAG: monovalent cation/H+ antiporter subunit D family protein [Planctomycetes bacterium]|nr:monovalent cation/H+ antiporter subunit D family protein [Planctomycetota bacterium]